MQKYKIRPWQIKKSLTNNLGHFLVKYIDSFRYKSCTFVEQHVKYTIKYIIYHGTAADV